MLYYYVIGLALATACLEIIPLSYLTCQRLLKDFFIFFEVVFYAVFLGAALFSIIRLYAYV